MRGRVLLIDDNVNLTTLTSRALSKAGYEVHVENDALQAMSTLRRVRPEVIVLDMMMPGRDGADILAEIRAGRILHPMPVVVLTALAKEAAHMSRLGGVDSPVLGKPVELRVLIGEIDRQLGVGRAA